MSVESIVQFFRKNGLLLIQIAVLSMPFIIFFVYFSVGETDDTIDIPSIEKVEVPTAVVPKVEKPASTKKEETKEEKQASASTFEIDEISQQMLDKNANNPQEILSGNSPCANFENVHTTAKHTGTISKAKNVDQFKKPLPAMISEIEYTCVDAKGTKQIKFTAMGVGVDSATNTLRCVQSNSDETMDSAARFQHVLKIMTHHCGFKLSEHQPVSTGKQP